MNPFISWLLAPSFRNNFHFYQEPGTIRQFIIIFSRIEGNSRMVINFLSGKRLSKIKKGKEDAYKPERMTTLTSFSSLEISDLEVKGHSGGLAFISLAWKVHLFLLYFLQARTLRPPVPNYKYLFLAAIIWMRIILSQPPRKKGTLTARRIRKRKRYLMVDAPGKEKEKRCVNCRLKPRNQKVEIRNGSWVHSSRSLS